jgi:hypothetical protein
MRTLSLRWVVAGAVCAAFAALHDSMAGDM